MKKAIKKTSTFSLLIGLFTLFTNTVKAEIINPAVGTLADDSEKAKSGETFVSYFVTIWEALITVGGLAVLLYFTWGAFEWITSGGDSGKLEKARNKMMHSIIGLLLIVSTFVILGFISQLLFGEEFNILNLTFTTPGSE